MALTLVRTPLTSLQRHHRGNMKLRFTAIATASLAVAMSALAFFPSPAEAHASLADSSPKQGQTMRTLPDIVSVTLNEPAADPAYLVVTGPDGKTLEAQDVRVDGKTVSSQIAAAGTAGAYEMAYRVVSVDSHVVVGTIKFEVTDGTDPATEPTPTPTPETARQPDADNGVAITSTGSSSDDFAAYIVIGFFILAMAGIVYIIRAGMRASGAEEDQ